MKRKLIAIALIAVLICVVVGNSFACTGSGTTTYTLTMSSTAGGSVTPAVGAHTYNATTVVNLVATPDADYHFVEWTGSGPVANVYAATTTITMNGDYTVTANFGFNMNFIDEVPDTNQPPTVTLPTTLDPSNYCAPMAMVNVLGYWDAVMGHSNAYNLTAFQSPPNLRTVAEYLGYFMDTNNNGSPARVNNGAFKGTLDVDIGPGTWEFIRWDAANLFLTPPPALPAGKLGYVWTVTTNCTTDYVSSLDFYKAEINAGRPLVVSFSWWNPLSTTISYYDPETGETIDVFKWGGKIYHSWEAENNDDNPDEEWYDDIGHAVTGVGYILNWDPDGSGPLPQQDYVIVHDNWATTPENVAIPWANWICLHSADPGP